MLLFVAKKKLDGEGIEKNKINKWEEKRLEKKVFVEIQKKSTEVRGQELR